ncbi:MAG: c-type cytochrome [Gammaproteobacteria bacterium]|nr:c-type cytochrome [Gammaproteobacteria bacterium]
MSCLSCRPTSLIKYLALLLPLISPLSVSAFEYLQPLPSRAPEPADNPSSAAKIGLGRSLFFDTELLGVNSKISCNSCHNLAQGGDDNRALSPGQNGRSTQRSAPSLWNIGFQTVLYWDGRTTSLEQQTLDHLRNPVISAWPNIGAMVSHLAAQPNYQQHFAATFNTGRTENIPAPDEVTGARVAQAMSSFLRSLLATRSPFDRYLAGDAGAISSSAKRGIEAFNESGCLACHFGANFAGPAPGPALKMGDGFYELFPNNLGSDYEHRYHLATDLGRYAFTGDPGERYMWRVPPLRGVAVTAPYFHNGAVASLEEAIRVMGKTQFGKDLNKETVRDIAAFLNSLTGEMLAVSATPR